MIDKFQHDLTPYRYQAASPVRVGSQFFKIPIHEPRGFLWSPWARWLELSWDPDDFAKPMIWAWSLLA